MKRWRMSAANIKAGIEITAQTDGADGIAKLEAAVGRLDAAAAKAGGGTNGLTRAGGRLGAQADALPAKLTPLSASISGMGRTMLAAAGVGGGLYAVKEGLQRILDTTAEFAAIKSRMEYAFSGAAGAAEQMEWVRGVAADLGLELQSAANGYAQLAAATKNINLSTADTQQVFKGVASAVPLR
ncbi:tape measure protein [Kingella potus]|uniref:tape measure protein n=1 Tax=Kingella potus TaxID=265175 RepID=UPI001FD331BB|nr:tape measure protein [Kingella potus]UOP02019.1 tape measure protein [Kingella potus]